MNALEKMQMVLPKALLMTQRHEYQFDQFFSILDHGSLLLALSFSQMFTL